MHSALFTVLRQELDRFRCLMRLVHKSLKELRLAVQGEVIMSQNLEDAYESILNQKVPTEWKVSFLFLTFLCNKCFALATGAFFSFRVPFC